MERFKNVRSSGKKRPNEDNNGCSQSKALCLAEGFSEEEESFSNDMYKKAVIELKEYTLANPRTGKVQDDMVKTRRRRRMWISSSKPNSIELIEEFPFLRTETQMVNFLINTSY